MHWVAKLKRLETQSLRQIFNEFLKIFLFLRLLKYRAQAPRPFRKYRNAGDQYEDTIGYQGALRTSSISVSIKTFDI